MFGEVLNPDPETRPEGMEHGLRYETYLKQVPAPYSPTRPAAEFIEDLFVRACAAVQPVLDLACEDSIAVDPAQTCLSVYAWLGQPPQRVDNYIVRQEALDVAAVVVNYAEAWECWQGLMHATA